LKIIDYIKVFGVADSDSDVRIIKFKLTDSIWPLFCAKFAFFHLIYMEKGYTEVFKVANYDSIIRFM